MFAGVLAKNPVIEDSWETGFDRREKEGGVFLLRLWIRFSLYSLWEGFILSHTVYPARGAYQRAFNPLPPIGNSAHGAYGRTDPPIYYVSSTEGTCFLNL